jgi:hypothetical protein
LSRGAVPETISPIQEHQVGGPFSGGRVGSAPRSAQRSVSILVAAFALPYALAVRQADGAAVILDGLLVRVYDATGAPTPERKRAYVRAGEILERVELEPAWLECPLGAARRPAACDVPLAPGEIVVRLVRASAQTDRAHPRTVGYSLIDSRTGTGTLATVFVDRVERLSAHAGSDRAALLGRAIAHEIGHLLLGTNAHSSEGLMREVWTFDDVRRNRAEDWQFTRAEREHLQAMRLARGGRAPAGAGTGGQNPHTLLNKTP